MGASEWVRWKERGDGQSILRDVYTRDFKGGADMII